MVMPTSLERSISPPLRTSRRSTKAETHAGASKISALAALEAGKASVDDHLSYFSVHLSKVVRPNDDGTPRLSISDYVHLYQRNVQAHGHHFVIHQHNHPVAGCHYDLRLQFSASSTCSFAIPYGLPGNPNSRRQGRLAIETRVHTLWNNLIESASRATGSLLIWDTGEYEILPRKMRSNATDSTGGEESEPDFPATDSNEREIEKLIQAFKSRYIRIRLHGTRLPKNYTITLRLPSANDVVKTSRTIIQRKRKSAVSRKDSADTDSDGDSESPLINEDIGNASDEEEAMSSIRSNNAYTGAVNDIGSVHQRHWFITLDKISSGFVKKPGNLLWVRVDSDSGFEPFYVRGTEIERSIVTGRTSDEVMADEGVEGFVQRKLWRPILV